MNSTATLLVEIEHPGLDEPLRLMSGQGFGILRTDSTGRDIYGFSHDGNDYLLFPLSFEHRGMGRLDMNIPSSYQDWFADMVEDGARIRFSAPRDEEPFTALPEEYRSGTGTLRIDRQDGMWVVMDKADPAGRDKTAGRGAEERPAPCRCREPHHEQHGHAHETGARLSVDIADQELARSIRKRAEGLNLLLEQAAAAGLDLRLSLRETPGACPRIVVERIVRNL